MNLQVQDFASMVKTQALAASSSCKQLLDVSIGSVLRALLEANASIGLWIQWLILQVLATTRAATSDGLDLDSWVADFGMSRLPSSAASGQVEFFRLSSGVQAIVPPGALVRTGTGVSDQSFVVGVDTSNPAWTGAGYQLSAGGLSVTAPVVAAVSGSAGNVQAGKVIQLATAIAGIDGVRNDAAFFGGLDPETDAALRVRFSVFLDSRARATAEAVGFAISSVQQGLSYTIAERIDASGAVRAGHFTVTIDDGSGAPPPSLIAQVSSAIDPIRPIGGTFSVRAPQVIAVDVAISISGGTMAAAAAQEAVSNYISGLPVGGALVASKITQVVHDASQAVTAVASVLINGSVSDLTPPVFGLIRPHSVSVSS